MCRPWGSVGISRKTGHKYIKRYADFGSSGLTEMSRRPHSSPHSTDKEIQKLILKERRLLRHLGTEEGPTTTHAQTRHLHERGQTSREESNVRSQNSYQNFQNGFLFVGCVVAGFISSANDCGCSRSPDIICDAIVPSLLLI